MLNVYIHFLSFIFTFPQQYTEKIGIFFRAYLQMVINRD